MALLKKPYEISVWKDKIKYVGKDSNNNDIESFDINDLVTVEYQYYDEYRVATIGSNTMTSPSRAIEPVLTRSVNGVETLKFSMYYQYVDEKTGELIHNPIINLLSNECKIKLYYNDNDPNHTDGWYDFIIKKDEERARDNKYNFTCTSLAANELGKTGFNIELDTELENNMGTVLELGGKVLENSDWDLDENQSSTLTQTVNEPLYRLVLSSDIEATIRGTETSETIISGSIIYPYYTPYTQQETEYFQFIYIRPGAEIITLTDKVTLVCDNENILDCYCTGVTYTNGKPSFQRGEVSIAEYRGDRYVRKQKTIYDPILKRTVNVYKQKENDQDKIYHGYETTEYIDVDSVINYIHNSTNFGSAAYWYTESNNSSVSQLVYPEITGSNVDAKRKSYLQVDLAENDRLYNNGIIYNYSRIRTFNEGESYIFRAKVGRRLKTNSNGDITDCSASTFPFKCVVCDTGFGIGQNIYFDFDGSGTNETDEEGISNHYVYFITNCENGASWENLKQNIYITFERGAHYNSNYYYYIEDIQFSRAIFTERGQGNHSIPYLKPGEIPAVRFATTKYYYDPSKNYESSDSYVYIKESKLSGIQPVYGSGEDEFEKIRSISKKESNRFNLIQELCETFECWVKFIVAHELDGRIKIISKKVYLPNNDGNYYYDWAAKKYKTWHNGITSQRYSLVYRKGQKKTVVFYKDIIVTNPIGFKYGINLKDVTRNLESDQIVTKIIVKNNTCEYAKNGFCSIARAKDNPTKENFLYNFNYYIKQGILRKNELNNDLYYPINGAIGLYPRLAALNKQRNEIIDQNTEIANSINRLTSEKQAAEVTYQTSIQELSRLNDPIGGSLVRLTGYTYEDFLNQTSNAPKPKKIQNTDTIEYYYNSFDCYKEQIYLLKSSNGIKYISSGAGKYGYIEVDFTVKGSGEINQLNDCYYRIENNTVLIRCKSGEEIQDGATYYYNANISGKTLWYIKGNENKFTKNNSKNSNLTASITYYYKKLFTDIFVSPYGEINNIYFQTATDKKTVVVRYENFDSESEIYIYGAYKRIAKAAADDTINDTSAINYLNQISVLVDQQNSSAGTLRVVSQDLDTTQALYDSNQEKLNDIANSTAEIEKEFALKYSRYIQEGSWIDENYIDDELYYLDAVNVLYQSAYPKVSYNISVLELSALEGYEAYKFQLAHKTFVEDTEFFGWDDYARRIPAREQIIVTELTTNLDEVDKNIIKVQNYKSHFEDLFQRITAATQSLEYHSGDYDHAADAIQLSGTIDQSVLQKSLATSSYIISNSNNQSVIIDETGLSATKTNDPAEVLKLTSGGLLISTDGGANWGVAISGYGINTNYLSAGTIDTEKLNIMNSRYPTFKWDSKGLRAISHETDDIGTLVNYDESKYVTFDQFGIYGINGRLNFEPKYASDVQNKANFALTWDGLFIRTDYRSGYVSVSPTDDIALYSYNNATFNQVIFSTDEDDDNSTAYYTNRSAFYYKDEDSNRYVQCTTESFNNIKQSQKTLYTKDYIQCNKPTQEEYNEIKNSLYYLDEGLYINCANIAYNNLPDDYEYLYFTKTNNSNPQDSYAIKRAKFGYVGSTGEDGDIFGLVLYDQDGEITVTTQSDGTLWLQDSMRIGTTSEGNTIYIGVGEIEGNKYRVINANNNFIVYSDGSLVANSANIRGHIEALSGTIGSNQIDEDGITIFGSGLKIVDPDNLENILFQYNPDTQSLDIKGSGNFSGVITAKAGVIGGFEIGEYTISSNDLILTSEHNDGQDHIDSHIYVKNITIGSGAVIEDYLQIGNLKLWNPHDDDNTYPSDSPVLTLGYENKNYFTLQNDGDIFGNGWSITKYDNSSHAQFDYIHAKDGIFEGTIYARDGYFTGQVVASIISATTITTANFITEKIRSMGGAFVFKPTFEIDEISKKSNNIIQITLKTNNQDNVEDYFRLDFDEKIEVKNLDESDFNNNKTSYYQLWKKIYFVEDFEQGTILSGGQYSTSNYRIRNKAEVYYSVVEGKTYEVKTNFKYYTVCFYNEEKEYVSSIVQNNSNDKFTVPANITYIKFILCNNKANSSQSGEQISIANFEYFYLIRYLDHSNSDIFCKSLNLTFNDFEQGTISNGKDISTTKRIRTKTNKYYEFEGDNPITLNTNFKYYGIFCYDENKNYLKWSGYINSDASTWIGNDSENNIYVKYIRIILCNDTSIGNASEVNINDFKYAYTNNYYTNDIIVAVSDSSENSLSSNFGMRFGKIINNEYYNEVELNSATFEENKTNYYYLDDNKYIQCTDESVFDINIEYYIRIYYKLDVKFFEVDYEYISNLKTITLYGHAWKDLLIGINSDDIYVGNILSPRAMGMEYFSELRASGSENNRAGFLEYENRLLLGDLEPLNNNFVSGYGLYSDNVFLKGALTTQYNNGSGKFNYAGIGTNNEVKDEKNFIDEKIIFWAGAEGPNSIQDSPFYVTDQGNIYASSGIFEGVVLSKSIIADTEILTPIIRGTGRTSEEPYISLKIADLNYTQEKEGGLGFYKSTLKDNNGNEITPLDTDAFSRYINNDGYYFDDELILQLTANGFYYYPTQKQFVKFGENYEEVSYITEDTFKDNQSFYYYKDGNNYIHCNNDSVYDSNKTYYRLISAVIDADTVVIGNMTIDNGIFTILNRDILRFVNGATNFGLLDGSIDLEAEIITENSKTYNIINKYTITQNDSTVEKQKTLTYTYKNGYQCLFVEE